MLYTRAESNFWITRMFELTGKTILLTGASKGIGAAIAATLGEASANLIAHYGGDRSGAEEATAAIPPTHETHRRRP